MCSVNSSAPDVRMFVMFGLRIPMPIVCEDCGHEPKDVNMDLKDFDLDDITGKLMGGTDVKKIASVIDAIWDHRDELARIAQELPQLLGDTGGHMQAAGEGAMRASAFLAGDVRELAGAAADMLEASKKQLSGVLKALEGVGKVLNNVPLIGDLGKSVGDGLRSLADVANSLDTVGQKIRGVGDRLGDVGADLDSMGRSLVGGGMTLAGFVGGKPPASKTKKNVANKKPVAKKAKKKSKKKSTRKKP